MRFLSLSLTRSLTHLLTHNTHIHTHIYIYIHTMTTRVQKLRTLLSEYNIDAFIIPSADPHQSEYVADAFKRRAFISGFDGSAGTAIVTSSTALLWTDGRYFDQAERQLSEEWQLMKSGQPGVPTVRAWLASNLLSNASLGIDPWVTSVSEHRHFKASFADSGKQIQIVQLDSNLVDTLWKQDGTHPALPHAPVFAHDVQYAGVDVQTKIANVRLEMANHEADMLVVTALDEVAWLFNLRGADIMYNPVFLSYATVTADAVILYVDHTRLETAACAELKAADVKLRPYTEIVQDLKTFVAANTDGKVWIDDAQCNVAVYSALSGAGDSQSASTIFTKQSPLRLPKAIKNDTELSGMRDCHVRDAAAVTRYLHWLEQVAAGTNTDDMTLDKLNEVNAADKLEQLRSEQKLYVGLSFETISASGANGGIIHYAPTPEKAAAIDMKHMYLCDSGGQYRDGTTDITRTIHLGTPTDFERECFTRVLRGHIGLAMARFPHGTAGPTLDVLARAPLWEVGLNYRHGTGHGVGAFLNVHEGPHGISATSHKSSLTTTKLVPGMVVSNEPGFYDVSKNFGIRIESVMAVVPAVKKHSFDSTKYYEFETIALAPIQQKLIDATLLTDAELKWLNDFHRTCFEKVSPLLKEQAPDTLQWLKDATAPIARS
jgi:Xaa-Pro aminopeptidase